MGLFVRGRWGWLVVLAVLVGSVLVPGPRAAAQGAGDIVISEFLTANLTGFTDNTGEREDWIELHNTTGSTLFLTNWSLSDANNTHVFGGGVIGPGEYLVVVASGDVSRSTFFEPHVGFKLSRTGEELVLRDPSGAISGPLWAPYPVQSDDVSYGTDSSGAEFFFDPPTPGAANTGGVAGVVLPVDFSVPAGFYTTAQTVVLDTPTPGATIRYTTDGSTPSVTNGTPIAPGQSVTVASTTNLRAVSTRAGWSSSGVETRSYLFAADILAQGETPPPGWPTFDVSGNGLDPQYGFDPDITAGNEAAIEANLLAIPSVSITTDLENLFDPGTGIWTQSRERGDQWEAPVSVEYIDPSGAEPGFDINAGLRIRGNSSRNPANFKHSMRLVFSDSYDGELFYPLFGGEGVDRFESVDVKTAQSWSWNMPHSWREGRGTDATWLRDVWNRDSQGAMGHGYARSRYVHVYLNGLYWGVYLTEERVSNQYGEQYFGGNEDDYDVIKRATGTSILAGATHVEARDGTLDDWLSLWTLVDDRLLTNAEWATFKDEVDIVNLADYYLLMFLGGDSDGTPRYTKDISNNWLAFRNRAGEGTAAKWQINDRDSESALCTNTDAARPPDWDPTLPWNLDASLAGYLPDENFLAPSWLFEAALSQPEFVQLFQDRVQKHMLTPGGALTIPEMLARLDARADVMNLVVDAESARWGDTVIDQAWDGRTEPYGRADWETAVDVIRDCFTLRTGVIETYLREDGLWPLVSPPLVSPVGGVVAWGSSVSVNAAGGGGVLWVTTDGSDPRGADGGVNSSAFVYNGPLVVEGDVVVSARLFDGASWSPLASETYVLGSLPDDPVLVVNEFNAVSASQFLGGGTAGDVANGSDVTFGRIAGNGGDWFELVVLDDVDLRGWTFEVSDVDGGLRAVSARLVLADDPVWANVRAGTIVTVSEDVADDVSFDPASGDWHVNVQANDAGDGAFFVVGTQSGFDINNDDTQIAVFDGLGRPEVLRTGEGTAPNAGVGSSEVFKLEGVPSTLIAPDSAEYADGVSSTWGLANVWGGGSGVQDLSGLRLMIGDASCDGLINIVDALVISQYTVGLRSDVGDCSAGPVSAAGVFVPGGDANGDGVTNIVDSLVIAQCEVGIVNVLCPTP